MQYDAIVVGAGLGGLCAAFELCRKGQKTLLLEQHNLPGGYASSFVRGRFEFEPSLHELPDLRSIKEASGVIRYLKDDADLDITFLSIPEAYRVILTDENVNVRMPFGRENLIDVIEKEVPGSRESVSNYMALCLEVQDSFAYLNNHQDDLNYLELLRKHGNFIRTGSYTAEEVADVLKVPRKARDILYAYWCYLGVPMDRMSFTLWAALLNSYIASGAVIPKDRSHEIASAFIQKIEALGGSVWFNSRVDKIEVDQNRIQSVKLASGEIIQTKNVICNTSPTRVFNTLISPVSSIPEMALKNVNSRIHGFSLVVVYLGLDIDYKTLGLEDYSYFIAPHMDTSRLYDTIHDIHSTELMQAAVCLNAANPDCSPPGTTILSMAAGQSADAWREVTPETYVQSKEVLADIMITQFEMATGVDLRSHIEEIEIATPQTFARYTDSYNGLVYGYEPEPWDAILPRALSLQEENYIQGLQFCGGYSYRSHGYGSSILSGRAAVERALSPKGAVS
ncbi:NAD(P)/FAD-dependent oxidoreductase [Oceanispirochaeta sp.]|jgi:phytoene dehydrogenase-like protein|uniref:phytoene desaturase family protein n=1 Tax=Oceanispirochaeta sp. TaxID=2035350 RepID=UPI002614BD64|nr:NAD(P)/FAD-dependent oxidoreductase [Oceanispirochaeta sp.]MDA3957361.1 NAD(P)/FAD-dependent oxidoreductase [Oceanispirochaeta sp.]